MSDVTALPQGWRRTTIGEETEECRVRVGAYTNAPTVLSSTKYHGLVPSDDFFRNRTVYSEDLSNYKVVAKDRFAYATNHLAEGSIGLQEKFSHACVSPIYTVFSCGEEIDPSYLQRVLKSPELISQYKLHEQASVDRRGAVRYRDFAKIRLTLPPLAEQRRIAEVLDSEDEVIRSKGQLIAKLEQVKQGLLHDLFDEPCHDGKTRWEYAPVGKLLEHLIDCRGRTPPGMTLGGGDILALSANNVQMGRVDASREAYYGSERLYRIWMTQGPVHRGDVLITMEAPLGNIARIPDDKKYILSQRVVLLRFAEKRVLNDFAYWYMQAGRFQRALIENSTGTTATGIRRARLEQIMFPIPNIYTQQLVARSAFAMQNEIDCERAAEAKLKETRQGLMNDLLTGRVRVGIP